MWENTALGLYTKLLHILCAGIGSLQLGVVLVLWCFPTITMDILTNVKFEYRAVRMGTPQTVVPSLYSQVPGIWRHLAARIEISVRCT